MDKLPKFPQESALAQSLKTFLAVEAYEKLSIGETIKKLRKKQGLTQKGLAIKLGTTQSVIARMENGKQNFTLATLLSIAHFLGKKLSIRFI